MRSFQLISKGLLRRHGSVWHNWQRVESDLWANSRAVVEKSTHRYGFGECARFQYIAPCLPQRKRCVSELYDFSKMSVLLVLFIWRAIEKLLSQSPHLLNSQKADGFAGLHLAALNGHNSAIECLLKHKANIEIVTHKMETPLLLAVAKLNVLSVELLVNQSKRENI